MESASNSKIQLFTVWFSQLFGGLCSRSSQVDRVFANSDADSDAATAAHNNNNNNTAHFTAPPPVHRQTMDRNPPGLTSDEVFYDGIPRYAAKVSEVGSRLRRAGLGKAVEVLDNLGSSMANLNAGSGFVSGAAMKGSEISILAFEVANTIVKGFHLLQSLSTKSIKHLKEEVLLSETVHDLVSKDKDELLRIVAADKRQELKVFSDEVIRFGNRSKDPQWHNLDRYFEKISKESSAQRLSRDEAESIMKQLMTSVQFTAELYHELHALDRFEQDIEHKGEEEDQRDGQNPIIGDVGNRQRLGPAGLALHYANIVLQIDTLVARSISMPANTRDTLYQNLPPNIKLTLRSKLPSFHAVEELTVADIKDEMEKTLHWLVPIATNTSKAHHGFGWVGEWANTGSEANKKVFPGGAMRIETFHYADKDKVEHYILELLSWLHRLAIKSKAGSDAGKVKSAMKSSVGVTMEKTNKQSTNAVLTIHEQNMLQDVSKKTRIKGISKSLDFDSLKPTLSEKCRLTKTSSLSSIKSKELSFNRILSKFPVIDFDIDKERALNVIDRLDVVR
ncbi:hypothetical protein TSUD_303380 [Trifolium subterraneum]|uniref:DUF668 domain-containing protein n=1 Tax=Trifolium subterraneum TaxID=3900 RepID=A0A2Z6LNS7_TRISU|nr:hypothetical protein TSUD_303380 [Trifolium subterraneum]